MVHASQLMIMETLYMLAMSGTLLRRWDSSLTLSVGREERAASVGVWSSLQVLLRTTIVHCIAWHHTSTALKHS